MSVYNSDTYGQYYLKIHVSGRIRIVTCELSQLIWFLHGTLFRERENRFNQRLEFHIICAMIGIWIFGN